VQAFEEGVGGKEAGALIIKADALAKANAARRKSGQQAFTTTAVNGSQRLVSTVLIEEHRIHPFQGKNACTAHHLLTLL